MAKHLSITVPHALGAEEVRRRIDRHLDWAVRRLEKEKIQVEAGEWSGSRRGFTGSGYGLKGSVAVQAADDSLRVEASVPWVIGMFAPMIEAVGQHYAGRLLADEAAT